MACTSRKAFAIGSSIGLVFAAAVVLSGALDVFLTPLWQEILLYPGFVAGRRFYYLTEGSIAQGATVWVGVLAVGAAYGGLAVLLRAVAIRLRRSAQSSRNVTGTS